MKQFAAVAVLAAVSASASAQSSVTLFGIVDASARYVKNGDLSVKSLASNGANTSRLGVRGTEDLGGGLKAGFWLETGINPDTGTTSDAARFWNRRSTVSLSSASLGELRLGRDFTPTYTGFSDYDAFGTNGVAAADKFSSTLGTAVDTRTRADNIVSYFAPSGLGGFYGQVSVAAGEGVVGKKYVGGRAGYAAGPLDVSVSLGQTEVAPNAAGEDKYKVAEFGASYDFGVAKLLGYYSQQKYADLKLAVANIGALVPLGQGTVRVSYIRANASGVNGAGVDTENNDANQLAIGYVYDLSKRTALYTTYARVNNKGAAAFAVDSNPALPAGKDSTGFELGIRHRF
ncbi:porin [Piscinibacter sp. XHJ-5]|uniref:porin n=1 Tax=Piscinibacter sp. XHJ-5 TaxID=3037797 RepID=UPI002452F389|nr:porin [Piscinibacter sp. XHJ-5]